MTNGSTDAEHLAAGINQIAELVMSEETVQSVLDLIVNLARSTVPVAEHVSVTVMRNQRLVTVAGTSSGVSDVDAVQYKRTGGPCVHALHTGDEVVVDDLRADERWPAFALAARDAGFSSVLAVPLKPVSEPIGVLNFYAKRAGVFDELQRGMARLLAHQAAIAFANSGSIGQSEEANDQLREALASRDVIGQAKGILMERGEISSDEAFDEMREESQRSQRKLRDVAEEIVKGVKRRVGHD